MTVSIVAPGILATGGSGSVSDFTDQTELNGKIINDLEVLRANGFGRGSTFWNVVQPTSDTLLTSNTGITNQYVGVNSSIASINVTLPLGADMRIGSNFFIKDENGFATQYPIIILPNGNNIDGFSSTRYIYTNDGYIWLQYTDTNTFVVQSRSFNVREISATTTLNSSDDRVILNSSGGIFTVTLPDVTSKEFSFKDYELKDNGSATTNNVTLASTSGQTVDGSVPSTYDFTTNYDLLKVQGDGSNWLKWS